MFHKAWVGLIAVYQFVTEVLKRSGIRFLLWALTIFGGLYPAIYASNLDPSLDFRQLAIGVNQAGLFKDMFYISVVVALIGICDIINIFASKTRPSNSIAVLLYFGAFIYFIYITIVGTGEFSKLASHSEGKFVVPDDRFLHDYGIIYWTCLIDLCVEGLLAFRGD